MNAKLVDAIIASFDDPRAEWKFDRYSAESRVLDCEVWIGNSHYGLAVTFKNKVDGWTQSTTKFGGVTAISSFFGPLIPWRRRLLNAAKAHLPERSQEDFLTRFYALEGHHGA